MSRRNVRGALGHDDQPGRQVGDLSQHPAMLAGRIGEHRVQRGDDRHPQVAQQPDDVAAGRAAEDAVFVLEADDIGVGEIEEIGRPQVGVDLLLLDFEPHLRRVVVSRRDVVDRHHEAIRPGILGRDRRAKVVRECRDPALPRQIVADECDFLNLAVPFHDGHANLGARRQEVKAGRDDPADCRSNVTAGRMYRCSRRYHSRLPRTRNPGLWHGSRGDARGISDGRRPSSATGWACRCASGCRWPVRSA